jgi:hypothetical protein
MTDDPGNSRPVSNNCITCGGVRNHGEYCAYCGALYPDVVATGSPARKLTSLAAKYRVEKFSGGIKISWRWWSASHLFLIPFALIWNSIVFKIGDWQDLLRDPLSLFPIPLVHMLIGIAIPLYVAISFINKTTIRADRQLLSIRHFPLPLGRKVSVPASHIQQIFVSRGQRSNKRNSWDVPVLQLITINGERIQLMKGRAEVEFADYESLRQSILEALGISVAHVAGAYTH